MKTGTAYAMYASYCGDQSKVGALSCSLQVDINDMQYAFGFGALSPQGIPWGDMFTFPIWIYLL